MAEGGAGIDLGKKIGPLPLGLWLLVVAAGLTVGYFINRNAGKKAEENPFDPNSDVGTGGGTFLPIAPPTEQEGDAVPQNNQSWGNKAITWLIAQNVDSVVANNAITKFLTGQTLSIQEKAAVAMALTKFGPPPEGVSNPPDDPKPAKPANLVVTGKTSNRVLMVWSPSLGADYYEVTWNTQFGNGGPVQTPNPTIASGPHDGRYNHTFFVRAINEFGKSEPAQINVTKWDFSVPKPPGTPPPKPPPPKPGPGPAPAPGKRQHTVAKGDTLWRISQRYYGRGTKWVQIYNANAGTIEARARAAGKKSSRGPNGTVGWWIYPGTVLIIP